MSSSQYTPSDSEIESMTEEELYKFVKEVYDNKENIPFTKLYSYVPCMLIARTSDAHQSSENYGKHELDKILFKIVKETVMQLPQDMLTLTDAAAVCALGSLSNEDYKNAIDKMLSDKDHLIDFPMQFRVSFMICCAMCLRNRLSPQPRSGLIMSAVMEAFLHDFSSRVINKKE